MQLLNHIAKKQCKITTLFVSNDISWQKHRIENYWKSDINSINDKYKYEYEKNLTKKKINYKKKNSV